MANIYLDITGSTQKRIEGMCDQKGREGKMIVLAMGHGMSAPYDSDTTEPLGRRQHAPISITKELDKASPKLYQALCTQEMLTKVTISFFRYKSAGAKTDLMEEYYTITLDEARISDIAFSASSGGEPVENLSLVYKKIQWKLGNVVTADEWKNA